MFAAVFDKRSSATDAAESNGRESERQRRRRREEIKDGIPRREIALQRAQSLQDEWLELKAGIERAVCEHEAACGTLQAELKSLEDRAVSRIQNREPADADEDSRRMTISREITDANRKLESFCSRERPLVRFAEVRAGDAGRAANVLPTESNLVVIGVGCPRLRAVWFASKCRLKAAQSRQHQASEALQKLQAGSDPETGAVFSSINNGHLADWLTERDAADSEFAAAQSALDSSYRNIVDE